MKLKLDFMMIFKLFPIKEKKVKRKNHELSNTRFHISLNNIFEVIVLTEKVELVVDYDWILTRSKIKY